MGRTQQLWILYCLLTILSGCSRSKEKTNPSDEYEIADPGKTTEGVVHTIEIKEMKFYPEELNVHKGDKVLWVNKDIVEHDVTELTQKGWASSKLPNGASWSMIVQKSEVYFCNLHVVMQGKIIMDGEAPAGVVESSIIPICR